MRMTCRTIALLLGISSSSRLFVAALVIAGLSTTVRMAPVSAGAGSPVAICGAMLVGLGVPPFRAAVICLIANTSPVCYGGLGVPVLTPEAGEDVLRLMRRAREAAVRGGHDTAIVDTAGRLHVDAELMDQLESVVKIVEPCETLYVADRMKQNLATLFD